MEVEEPGGAARDVFSVAHAFCMSDTQRYTSIPSCLTLSMLVQGPSQLGGSVCPGLA